MKIGITGENGFVGNHLKNFLSLQSETVFISFDRSYFDNPEKLDKFVQSCDTIIHLAGLNRHSSAELMYDTNVNLCTKLVDSCRRTKARPHILFSSSTQEDDNTLYGQSKRKGREILEAWAKETNAIVTGAIIPNVFGPFGIPFYNSVVATFCHQLIEGEKPTVIQDKNLNLIYVNDLIERLYKLIINPIQGKVDIPYKYTMSVSSLLFKLGEFKEEYFDKGIIPDISESINLDLFNTFRCYIPHEFYPVSFKLNTDDRGSFVEIARTKTSGQFSYSTTKPGITRGNHYHTRKAERFAVIKGKAKISLRKIGTNDVIDYFLDGNNPAFVDMPVWTTHNITNIGEEELVTLFWINEPFDPNDPDTYFVEV